MTYFEARKVEALFRRYRQLAVDYWSAINPIDYGGQGWMAGPGAPTHEETDASRELRREIASLLPEVQLHAKHLGVAVEGLNYPPAAVGGSVIPFNFLGCVTNQWVGYRSSGADAQRSRARTRRRETRALAALPYRHPRRLWEPRLSEGSRAQGSASAMN